MPLSYRNDTLGKLGVLVVFLKINRSHYHRKQVRTSRNYYPVLQQSVGCNSHVVREEIPDHDTQMGMNIKAADTIVLFCLTGPCLRFGIRNVAATVILCHVL